jgi:hypothetical protein
LLLCAFSYTGDPLVQHGALQYYGETLSKVGMVWSTTVDQVDCLFKLSQNEWKAYSGIEKAQEFQRLVTSLLSASSRGAAGDIVHSLPTNHLDVHNVIDRDDVAPSSAATIIKRRLREGCINGTCLDVLTSDGFTPSSTPS